MHVYCLWDILRTFTRRGTQRCQSSKLSCKCAVTSSSLTLDLPFKFRIAGWAFFIITVPAMGKTVCLSKSEILLSTPQALLKWYVRDCHLPTADCNLRRPFYMIIAAFTGRYGENWLLRKASSRTWKLNLFCRCFACMAFTLYSPEHLKLHDILNEKSDQTTCSCT